MAGLDPAIQARRRREFRALSVADGSWMAGSSPAMTLIA